MPFCPSCGAEFEASQNAAFCMSCGKPLPKPKDSKGQSSTQAAPQDLLNMIEKAGADTQPTAAQSMYLFGQQPQEQDSADVQTTAKSGMALFGDEATVSSEPYVSTSSPEQQPSAAAPPAPPATASVPLSVSQIQQNILANATEVAARTVPPTDATQMYRPVHDVKSAASMQQPVQPQYSAQQQYTQRPPIPMAPVTRAAQSPPPPRTPLPPYSAQAMQEPAPRKKRTALKVIIFTLVFAVLLGAATLFLLWYQNRPEKTIDTFVAAVMASDLDELRSAASVSGINPTDEQWQAFCAGFRTDADANALKNQLNAIVENTPQTDAPYPTITIERQDLFLFISRYRIAIAPVEILVPSAAAGSTLRLNSTDYTGATTMDGELYTGIMPGFYSARIAAQGQDPANSAVSQIEVYRGGTDNPYIFEGTLPYVSVTVENCLSDDAAIYVNGEAIAAKPVGGVLTLDDISLGSIIRIELTHEGQLMEASVVYSFADITALRFENYTPVPGSEPPTSTPEAPALPPTEEQINELVIAYYQSYLNCINTQSMAGLVNSTQSHATALEARVTSEDNKPYTFEYIETAIDGQSIATSEDGTRIRVNAQFSYRYTPREGGSATDGSNTQTLEIIYENERWLVNRMEFVSAGDFGNHIHADL